MTHPLQVIQKNVPVKFLRETLHRPWMRMQIFLDEGPLKRTPECYKKFLYEWKVTLPSPVHYIPEPGIWKEEKNLILPIQNVPIPLKYPIEMHQGIWGGEAVIKGYEQRKWKNRRLGAVAKYWVPRIVETVLYSEILDRYMKCQVTRRALDLIDQHYGLDSYILKTPPADLYTELSLKLKREMLFVLFEKSLYPDNPEKREEIYNKYKEFVIPLQEEEIEWFGLTISEAYRKQSKIEEKEAFVGPYKHIFRKELIAYLKENQGTAEPEEEATKKDSILGRLKSMYMFERKK